MWLVEHRRYSIHSTELRHLAMVRHREIVPLFSIYQGMGISVLDSKFENELHFYYINFINVKLLGCYQLFKPLKKSDFTFRPDPKFFFAKVFRFITSQYRVQSFPCFGTFQNYSMFKKLTKENNNFEEDKIN